MDFESSYELEMELSGNSKIPLDQTRYRKGAKKAKTRIGFAINRGIPLYLFLTDGNRSEKPSVSKILEPGSWAGFTRAILIFLLFDK